MNGLLLDKSLGKLSAREFATTLTESFYTNLRQNAGCDVFPPNCHANAAVNSLSIEQSDYQFMLSGCADSSIKLWDLRSQVKWSEKGTDIFRDDNDDYESPLSVFENIATVPRKTAHAFGVSCVQWWPFDTGMFISSSFDHKVKVWDTNELTPVHDFDISNRVYSFDTCGHAPNSNLVNALVAVASDQPFLRLLDIRTSGNVHTVLGHKGKTLCVKWHPLDPYILASGGFDGEVKLWDIRRSKSCLCRLDMLKTSPSDASTVMTSENLVRPSVKAHLGPVNGLAWDSLGMTLFSTGNDDKIRVWDMASSLPPPVNKLINFGPLTRNKYLQTIPLLLNFNYESELQYLFFPSDNTNIYVFRAMDGKLVSRLARHGSKTSARTSSMVSAGPFTGSLYCGTMDGEILCWSPYHNGPTADQIIDYGYLMSESPDTSKEDTNYIKEEFSKIYRDPYFNKPV